jgi:L-fuculose-phosphate aldolase
MSEPRQVLLETSRRMVELGLNRGTSGNASVREGESYFITPSALPAAVMTPDSMVRMDLSGRVLQVGKPSTEWRIHRDLYAARPEVGAVIHAHSIFAATLACLRRDVPAVHYMIALAGGDSIRCAPYSVFGEQALSDDVLRALHDRKACLLANHGMVAVGHDLEDALAVAVEVESICEIYWRTLLIGEPHILTAQEMEEVRRKFADYKKRSPAS